MSKIATVCPACLNPALISETLPDGEAAQYCAQCGGIFPTRHDVTHFIDVRALPIMDLSLIATWHITQQAAAPLYQENNSNSCSTVDRADVQTFRNFMNLRGKVVLDLGSGVFQMPGYVQDSGCRQFIGIDPLPVNAPAAFELYTSLAEQLPFPDASFDVVILATSLDHVLNVQTTLAEIARVLKPNGDIYFWGGLVEHDTAYKEVAPHPIIMRGMFHSAGNFAADLVVYEQAQVAHKERLSNIDRDPVSYKHLLYDQYHVRHFSASVLIRLFSQAGFSLVNEQVFVNTAGVRLSTCMQFRIPLLQDTIHIINRQLAEVKQELHSTRQAVAALHADYASLIEGAGGKEQVAAAVHGTNRIVDLLSRVKNSIRWKRLKSNQ
jgi:ubiquinone/menaquinone biosynthesis C-methylase UbiE